MFKNNIVSVYQIRIRIRFTDNVFFLLKFFIYRHLLLNYFKYLNKTFSLKFSC